MREQLATIKSDLRKLIASVNALEVAINNEDEFQTLGQVEGHPLQPQPGDAATDGRCGWDLSWANIKDAQKAYIGGTSYYYEDRCEQASGNGHKRLYCPAHAKRQKDEYYAWANNRVPVS